MAFWLSQRKRPSTLVFLDDDLGGPKDNETWLELLVAAAHDTKKIVGVAIGGMVDESRLDRLRRRLIPILPGSAERPGKDDRRLAYPLSGGCLAVPCYASSLAPFPHWYNEDWLFCMEREADGVRVARLDGVRLEQRPSRDRIGFSKLSQEAVGQILFRVVSRLPRRERRVDSVRLHMKLWEVERRRYLEEVREVQSALVGNHKYYDLKEALENLKMFICELAKPPLLELAAYASSREFWRKAFKQREGSRNRELSRHRVF